MKLDFNLQVTQKQGIALTAQVQQAIKLLHMTNMEIQEYVDDQFQDNPFIETTGEFSEQKQAANNQNEHAEIDKSLEEKPYNQSQNENKLAQENQFETGEGYIPKSTVAKADLDFDAISLVAEEKKSLYAHCLDHINNLNLPQSENLIALRLLEELEPTGWISEDIRLIAQEMKCELEVLENVLLKLQEIEPAGLFARSLKECLILQARDSEQYCENLAIVLENLHLMATGKFDLLKRRSGCSDEEIAIIFRKIKAFDPKPGLKFESLGAPIREPDLQVSETEDGWTVDLNNSTLPEVKINKEYAQDVREKVRDKEQREFIREKVSEASLTFSLMNSRCSLSLTFSRTSCAYSLLILTSGKVELFKSTVQPSSVSETCKSGSLIGAPRLSNFNPGFGSKALIFLKIIAISSSEQPLRLFNRSNLPVAIKCRFSKTIAKFSQYCSLSLAWRIRHSLRLRANRPAGSIS